MEEPNEQEKQELMMKLGFFEQQIRQIQQQIQAIEQGIVEMTSLNSGLEELQGKKDAEILAPIGRGIYAKAKLLSEELIVNVGSNNLVTKGISETRKLIESQIQKLEEIKVEMNNNLENLGKEIESVMGEKHEH
ncbi:MAG: prefoldin subunit alpha [Nanoarchaeota archaeon]|nr:prefoldin subunit alpha [Nanoarchaeota archaeon]